MKTIDDVYKLVKKCCYDLESRRERFETLINSHEYKKVGFWPASAGTQKILDVYKKIFGDFPFEIFLLDSNQDFHGKEKFGHIVHSKEEAKELGLDCLIITSFNYKNVIFEQIKYLEQDGIDVKILYQQNDVDWWW